MWDVASGKKEMVECRRLVGNGNRITATPFSKVTDFLIVSCLIVVIGSYCVPHTLSSATHESDYIGNL